MQVPTLGPVMTQYDTVFASARGGDTTVLEGI